MRNAECETGVFARGMQISKWDREIEPRVYSAFRI